MELRPRPIGVRVLPTPDMTEFAWDPDCVCVIVSEGDPLADVLARQLFERGWRVVVVAPSITGTDSWPSTGRVAACIDIHAPARPHHDQLGDTEREGRLRMSFLLARQLSPLLNDESLSGAWFVTVTQLDGRLGTGVGLRTSGIVSAGAIALAKTLRHEWPTVLCRAVDLHPDLDTEKAASLIIAELFDPDTTLSEVGHDRNSRWTLAALEPTEAMHA